MSEQSEATHEEPQQEIDRCATCHCYKATDIAEGQCHRNAPTVFMAITDRGPAFVSAWPTVPAGEWCAMHRVTGRRWRRNPVPLRAHP